MTLKHAAVVVTADDGTSEVGSNEWNADHVIATDLSPSVNGNASLGVSGTAWSNLFLASGATVNFAASNLVVTHGSGILSVTGATAPTIELLGTATSQTKLMFGLTTDANNRISLGLDSSDNPFLGLGPGGATSRDTFISRSAAGTVRIGTASTNASGALSAASVTASSSVNAVNYVVTSTTTASNVTILGSTATTAPYTLKLPVDDGTASQFLQTDGAGVLSWASSSALTNFTSDGTTLSGSGQTVTASAPVLSLTQTWNNAAVVFTALKINIVKTAAAGQSIFFDFQKNGAQAATLYYDDNNSLASLQFGGATGGGITSSSGNILLGSIGAYWLQVNSTCVQAGTYFGLGSAVNNADVAFGRVAAALAEINPASAAGVAYLRLNGVAVASLPAASATYKGARGTVTDANSNTFNTSVVAATSTSTAQIVPVFCDGTAWKIG